MSELMAVAVMGNAAFHNLYSVFDAAKHAIFGGGCAKISGIWLKGCFLIVFD